LTIDERIEAIGTHLELLSHMHQDLEKKHQDFAAKLTAYSADVKDAIARLANIAAAHEETLEDHENRLDKLGG
jgi:hypothetical protein